MYFPNPLRFARAHPYNELINGDKKSCRLQLVNSGGFMEESRSALYQKCKQRLLKVRQDRLNGLKALEGSLSEVATGDEGDLASTFESQHTAIAQREKLLMELREMDNALSRIESGSYGVCEETGEDIESDRLLAIPWTKLSIEGAETREKMRKKFA